MGDPHTCFSAHSPRVFSPLAWCSQLEPQTWCKSMIRWNHTDLKSQPGNEPWQVGAAHLSCALIGSWGSSGAPSAHISGRCSCQSHQGLTIPSSRSKLLFLEQRQVGNRLKSIRWEQPGPSLWEARAGTPVSTQISQVRPRRELCAVLLPEAPRQPLIFSVLS